MYVLSGAVRSLTQHDQERKDADTWTISSGRELRLSFIATA
jgi:hypothetical protein